jgi:hypothetical protein
MTTPSTLGDLILALYQEYQEVYADDDLAAVAAAATVNELLAEAAEQELDILAA